GADLSLEMEYNERGGGAGRSLAPSNRSGRKVRTPLCVSRERATRLVTPGDAVGWPSESPAKQRRHGKCHRKQTAAKECSVTGGRETCSSSCKSAFAGKGETVG